MHSYFQFIYTDVLAMSPVMVTLLWSIYNVVKIVAMLFAGKWNDSHTGTRKWLPLTLSSILLLLSFCVTWIAPSMISMFIDPSHKDLAAWSLVVIVSLAMGFSAIGFAFIFIIRGSLFNELFKPSDRSSVAGIFQIFFVISFVLGFVGPPFIGGENWQNLRAVALLAIPSALSFLAFIFSVYVLEYQKDKNTQRNENNAQQGWDVFLAPLKSLSYRYLMSAWFFVQLGTSILIATWPLYRKYIIVNLTTLSFDLSFLPWSTTTDNRITLGPNEQVGVAQFVSQLLQLIGVLGWIRIQKRYGNVVTWFLSTFLFAFTLLTQAITDRGDSFCLFLFQILGSIIFGGLPFVQQVALSDVIDEDERNSPGSASRKGSYQAVSAILLTFSSVLQGVISSTVLSYGGYIQSSAEENRAQQSPTALLAIVWLYLCIPGALGLLSSFIILGYPLTPSKLAKDIKKTE